MLKWHLINFLNIFFNQVNSLEAQLSPIHSFITNKKKKLLIVFQNKIKNKTSHWTNLS